MPLRPPGFRRKLWKNGATARGVVVESKEFRGMVLTVGGDSSGGAGTTTALYRVRMLVHYPDGTEAELPMLVKSRLFSAPDVGKTYPLRFDETDRTKVVIDRPAIEARKEKARQEMEKDRLREAKEQLRHQHHHRD